MQSNVLSGYVPPRLVVLWQRVPSGRVIQLVYEWEAIYPDKWVIECHEGAHITARSDQLDWDTVVEFLAAAYDNCGGNVSRWYEQVLARLCAEGGDN